jgi:HD-like signal output (HDOD) protein
LTPKKNILIANSNTSESGEILDTLGAVYHALLITSKAEYDPEKHGSDLLLLYTNFTKDKGLDFIMEVTSQNPVPIVTIVDIENQECAVKAMQTGAFNYLIKTSNYLEILPYVIGEALKRFAELEEFKRTIGVMSERIAKLETQPTLGGSSSKNPETAGHSQATGQKERKPLIEEIVNKFRKGEINIPAYPEINIKFARLINEDASLAQITDLLKEDMSIVSNLIRLSNSAAYSGGKKIQTLEQAIYHLGLKQTQSVVEIISNRAFYTNKNTNYPVLLKSIWKHSIACAHASAVTARQLRHSSPDELFTMGLLHDIGFLMLLQIISELETSKTFDVVIENDSLLDFLKAHHGSFGRALLRRWKLPEQYATAAMYHEDLDTPEAPSTELLVIHFANLLTETMGYGLQEAVETDLENTISAKTLGLSADAITEIKNKVTELVESTSVILLESG